MLSGPPSMEIPRTEGEEDIIAAKLQKLENASRTVLSDLRAAAFPRDIGRGELQRSP